VPFVPDDFDVPPGLATPGFVLAPLGPEHNEDDYAAWSTSIEHIHATPGFEGSRWPHEMTLAENLADLEGHAADFAARRGFTYTVLDPSDGGTIGCVYIYPAKDGAHDATVSSWVRADRAALDAPLRVVVREWLAARWPFRSAAHAG
jgi:hypothetical protein